MSRAEVGISQLLGKAQEAFHQEKLPEAESLYEAVIAKTPLSFRAWAGLGLVRYERARYLDAEAAYRVALLLSPQASHLWVELGNALLEQGRLNEARLCYQKTLKKRPNYNPALIGLIAVLSREGMQLLKEKRIQEAEEKFQEALKLDPEHPNTHVNLMSIRLVQGRFREGWKSAFYSWERARHMFPLVSSPRWQGGSLKGRQILVLSEQGNGDMIYALRYCSLLSERGAEVIVACPKRFFPLLKVNPQLSIHKSVDVKEPLPETDFFTPMGVLPSFFYKTVESIPHQASYLQADPSLVECWKQRLKPYRDKLCIGIAWQGNSEVPNDKDRSIPLKFFAPLASIPGVRLFSLQREEEVGEQGFDVHCFEPQLDSDEVGAFMDTAAIMQCMDLVITSDTSIVHLAGALGVPTWLATPFIPYWFWFLDRQDNPWYPTLRLFRQQKLGDWGAVFEKMAESLCQQFADKLGLVSLELTSQNEGLKYFSELEELNFLKTLRGYPYEL